VDARDKRGHDEFGIRMALNRHAPFMQTAVSFPRGWATIGHGALQTGDCPMRGFLALIGFLAIVGAIAAAVYFFGGFYSVGGTAEEPAFVKWALVNVRQASISRQATERPPASFDSQAAVQAGAKAFSERGCVNCHGAPGVEWAKWSEGLRPDPPDLKEIVPDRQPRELFWVVQNGINTTGMPSFKLAGVEDPEIWNIVAFIKKLPIVSEQDYKSWTARPAGAPATSPSAAPPP
jgi:mono/diheme cytochrome c family protein